MLVLINYAHRQNVLHFKIPAYFPEFVISNIIEMKYCIIYINTSNVYDNISEVIIIEVIIDIQ